MRKLLIILFVLFSFVGYSQIQDSLQDEYYREIDWKFYPADVVILTDSTYEFAAEPFDYNDPGAIERKIGNYVVDFIGHRYLVIDSTSTTISVWDQYETGQAPQTNQIARCYKSVGGGVAEYVGSVDYSTLDLSARWKINGADNELLWRQLGQPFDSITFNPDVIPIPTTEYTIYADTANLTLTVNLPNGIRMQVNQESLTTVYNNTADTLKDGRVIGVDGIANDLVAVRYVSKTERHDFFGVTTADIPPYTKGLIVSIEGKVNDINTGTLTLGAIYVDSLGYFTNENPQFPYYDYPVGLCIKTGVTDGIIQWRSDGVNYRNSITHYFDGAIRETFDFRTYSDGINSYGILSNPNGSDKLTLVYSDGWYDFQVPDTIQLISGTATTPQIQYAYIDAATRTLQVSSGGYPIIEHSKVATLIIADAVSTQDYGALRNQNINDHFKSDDDNGHVLHMAERIRVMNAEWESGTAASLLGTPTNVYIDVTGGKVWQMHLQTFPTIEMSSGDGINIVNDPVSPYRNTTNLNDITVYSDGSNWNNEWGNIVIWGVCNKTGEISHLMCNLPSDGYLQEDAAVEDPDNFTNYTIPRDFRGVGFLIGRFTIRRSGGNFTYNSGTGYLDLRGYMPNNTVGGGTGSSGITDYTQLDDTPSSLIALAFQRASADGTALENVLAGDVLLTEFDSAGFSVDYSQVNNTPTIGDGLVTIQGSAVENSPETFTLNQTTPKTITINQADVKQAALDTITLASHGFVVGDVIDYNAKAIANNPDNANVIGIVYEVIDVNTFTYQHSGLYDKGSWVVGMNYFLSTSVAGETADTTQLYEVGDVYLFIGTGVDGGLQLEIDVGFLIEEQTSGADTIIGGYGINVNYAASAATIAVDTSTIATTERVDTIGLEEVVAVNNYSPIGIELGSESDGADGDIRVNVGTDVDKDGITIARRKGLANYQTNLFHEGGSLAKFVIENRSLSSDNIGSITNRIGNTSNINTYFAIENLDSTRLLTVDYWGNADFSGTVSGDDAVLDAEYVTKGQADSLYTGSSDSRQTLTSGAAITFDYDLGNDAELVLATNATITFQDVPDFGNGDIELRQDATGSRTLAFAENITGVTSIDEGIVSNIQPDASTYTIIHYKRRDEILYVTIEWR